MVGLRVAVLALVCLSVISVGCSGGKTGPRVYSAKGKVLFKGEPPVGAKIGFIPVNSNDGALAWATVANDGQFQLTTRKQFDGAQKGDYNVVVSWTKPINPNSNDTNYSDELLPAKYQDPANSGLRIAIEAKSNLLKPIELE